MFDTEVEIERIRAALRAEIARRRVSMQELDQTLGDGKNATSQLLRGRGRLRFDQIYDRLRVLEISPREFFLRLYAPGVLLGSDQLTERLVEVIGNLADTMAVKEPSATPRRESTDEDPGTDDEGGSD
jgi:hypothetical protein